MVPKLLSIMTRDETVWLSVNCQLLRREEMQESCKSWIKVPSVFLMLVLMSTGCVSSQSRQDRADYSSQNPPIHSEESIPSRITCVPTVSGDALGLAMFRKHYFVDHPDLAYGSSSCDNEPTAMSDIDR